MNARLRHRIVHEYFGIDLQLVWVIIHTDLPKLRETLRDLAG
ncbi:MAG: HepT-like ribonuclease domain-containing protein [Thermoleophilia bacterium]